MWLPVPPQCCLQSKFMWDAQFLKSDQYSYTVSSDSTTITLNETYLPTDVIEVLVLSDQISSVGFYQVPVNLQNNPLNGNSPSFTLGTIRTQYESICENLSQLSGPIQVPTTAETWATLCPMAKSYCNKVHLLPWLVIFCAVNSTTYLPACSTTAMSISNSKDRC
jgi:hypothetical protein